MFKSHLFSLAKKYNVRQLSLSNVTNPFSQGVLLKCSGTLYALHGSPGGSLGSLSPALYHGTKLYVPWYTQPTEFVVG